MKIERISRISQDTLRETKNFVNRTLRSPKTPVVLFVANTAIAGLNLTVSGDIRYIGINVAGAVMSETWCLMSSEASRKVSKE